MKECNILVTSVSRKVWLIKAFKEALKKAEVNGKVISTDINPLSAGLYVSDGHYISPPSSDTSYIPFIQDLCKMEDITLLIPTRDAELSLFSDNEHIFENEGVFVNISTPEVIKICSDKYLFYQFLKKAKFATPKTYLPEEIADVSLNYPVILKSRRGSGSKGIYIAKDESELTFYLKQVQEPIIQEFVEGIEYTIDVLSDKTGKVLSIVPRERIETVCGESYKSKTVRINHLIESTKKLTEHLRAKGHITIQCIIKNQIIYFIEINPRFGGGAMLGIRAGADTSLLLIKMAIGEEIKPIIGEFEEDLIMLRYTKDIYIPKKRLENYD